MLQFHQHALEELRQARNWYRERSQSAAVQFLFQVEQALHRLLMDPESYAELGRGYRSIPLKQFPYSLVFQVRSESHILIVAVAHSRRKEGYWKRRQLPSE